MLSKLNEQQLKAVKSLDGIYLLIAAAGVTV